MHEDRGTLISAKELSWRLSPGKEVILLLKMPDGTIRRRSRIVSASSEDCIVMTSESPGDSVISFIDPGMRIYLTDDSFVLRSGDTESRYLIVRSGDTTNPGRLSF